MHLTHELSLSPSPNLSFFTDENLPMGGQTNSSYALVAKRLGVQKVGGERVLGDSIDI